MKKEEQRIEEARSTTHTIGTFWETVAYDTTVRDSALFLLGNTGLQSDNVIQLIQNLEDFAETNNAIVELNLTATAHNLNTDNIRTIEIRPSGITNSQSSMIYDNSVVEGNNVFIGRIDIAAPSNSFGENFLDNLSLNGTYLLFFTKIILLDCPYTLFSKS